MSSLKVTYISPYTPIPPAMLTAQHIEDRFDDSAIPWKQVIIGFTLAQYLFDEVETLGGSGDNGSISRIDSIGCCSILLCRRR